MVTRIKAILTIWNSLVSFTPCVKFWPKWKLALLHSCFSYITRTRIRCPYSMIFPLFEPKCIQPHELIVNLCRVFITFSKNKCGTCWKQRVPERRKNVQVPNAMRCTGIYGKEKHCLDFLKSWSFAAVLFASLLVLHMLSDIVVVMKTWDPFIMLSINNIWLVPVSRIKKINSILKTT